MGTVSNTIAGLIAATCCVALAAVSISAALVREVDKDLPSINPILTYTPTQHSTFLDASGNEVLAIGEEKRNLAVIGTLPQNLISAFLSAEDKNFWDHNGFDVMAIVRAAASNTISGSVQSGASTITQQLVKNILLSPEQSIRRKIQEVLLAADVEDILSKEDILERYLNEIYLGRGSYGVVRASEVYFDKRVDELSLGEVAFLAGLPKAPSRFSSDPVLAEERRQYVLGRMLANGFIEQQEYDVASAEKTAFKVLEAPQQNRQSHFIQAAIPDVKSIIGQSSLTTGGYRISLSQDPEIQRHLSSSLQDGLSEYAMRHDNWSEPMADQETFPRHWTLSVLTVNEGVLGAEVDQKFFPLDKSSIDWIDRSSPHIQVGQRILFSVEGDAIRLRQIPEVQGAAVALDAQTGRVLGMTGAFSEDASFFNRAVAAQRQPGSILKPFVYAMALQQGWAPTSPILDGGLALQNSPAEEVWRPRDHNLSSSGFVTLRSGLEYSRNTVTVRLAQALGMENVASMLESLSIYENAPTHRSLPLGSEVTSLINVARAFTSLSSGDGLQPVSYIDRIETPDGDLIYQAEDVSSPEIYDEVTQTQIRSMLKGVTEYGTGWRAFEDAEYTVFGKTGTTNETKDAWFVGFTQEIIVAVYVGFDQPKPLGRGESGGSTAAPIVRAILDKMPADTLMSNYRFPPSARIIEVDPDTGVPAPGGFEEIVRR